MQVGTQKALRKTGGQFPAGLRHAKKRRLPGEGGNEKQLQRKSKNRSRGSVQEGKTLGYRGQGIEKKTKKQNKRGKGGKKDIHGRGPKPGCHKEGREIPAAEKNIAPRKKKGMDSHEG